MSLKQKKTMTTSQEANRLSSQRYYEKHKHKIKIRCAIAYASNPKKHKERARRYYELKKDEIKRKTISTFDEMFVTNSVIKILPVSHLSSKKFKITNATKEMINFFLKKSKRSKNLELV